MVALREERALPSGVVGPVDRAALARLAAIFFSDVIFIAGDWTRRRMLGRERGGGAREGGRWWRDNSSYSYYWDAISKCFHVSALECERKEL